MSVYHKVAIRDCGMTNHEERRKQPVDQHRPPQADQFGVVVAQTNSRKSARPNLRQGQIEDRLFNSWGPAGAFGPANDGSVAEGHGRGRQFGSAGILLEMLKELRHLRVGDLVPRSL